VTGIDKAIEAAGGEVALAELLGVSQQAVNKMKQRGYCAPKRAEQIANNFPINVDELIDPTLVEILKGPK
jgi:DNA-binding transcriptional regulator YdaS (Cro superfamily)